MPIFKGPEAKNKDIESVEELDEQGEEKVKRADGLPTKDDMEEILNGKKNSPEKGKSNGVIELIIKIIT